MLGKPFGGPGQQLIYCVPCISNVIPLRELSIHTILLKKYIMFKLNDECGGSFSYHGFPKKLFLCVNWRYYTLETSHNCFFFLKSEC